MYRKSRIRLNESQLRQIVKESVKRVLRENDDEPFLKTGFGSDSKYFKRFDTTQGPLVLYNGKVYQWSFVDFMRHKDEMIEKHGSLSNKAVGDWMSNGGLRQSNVNPEDLQGMEDEWQRGKDEEKRKAAVVKEYRAEFENACDDLYYGYGYKFWLESQRHNGSDISDEDAKIVWQAAFDKMANED